jgi:mannosyltransferase
MGRAESRRVMRDRRALFLSTAAMIVLLAAGLRFAHLDAQSFWNDEGNTARLVERTIPLIIEGAAGDIHPPGYYLILHGWRALTGETEYALRAYSALCGILTVAVVAAVGRQVAGRRAALGAALVLAVHPLAVYYSQEARMYAQLGLATALTLWVGTRLTRTTSTRIFPRPRIILGLGLAVGLGLYTHYAYGLALVGLNAAFFLAWLAAGRGRWRLFAGWTLGHLLGGLAFLPWAPIALGARNWQPPDITGASAIDALVRAALVGITLPDNAPRSMAFAAGAVLLILGLLTPSQNRFGKWMAVGTMLAPPALLLLLGAYRPAYLKFMMASVPAMAAVAALPLSPRSLLQPPIGSYVRRARTLLGIVAFLAGLLPVQITALDNLYTDPAYRRDDYRAIAARIEAEVTPDDAIVLSAPNQWEVFTYYYKGTAPVHPAPYRPSEGEAEAWIAEIVAAHDRLFVLYWGDQESDPERHIERALARQAYKAGETWITSVRYARYGTGPLASTPGTEVSRSFGPAIDLRGFTLPDEAVRGGTIVPLTLFWHPETTPDRRLKVFVHILDADRRLVAQTDREPVGGLYPTDRWQPDEVVVDRYGISLPADAPPGTYTVIAGLYDFSGERLRVTGPDGAHRDHATLGTLTVRPPQ